ncbi:MAG: hypothetical protein JWM27_1313 [Gemmatimonadetes bacterium]|nr:hypothetical protein [Gemmatimonadota bacterium]
MKRLAVLTLLGLSVAAAPVVAQGPGPAEGTHAMHAMHPGGPGGPGGLGAHVAGMLLSQTGALKLSDAQVQRLAAITRRAQERMQALHAGMEAAHRGMQPGQQPSAADMQRMHQAMEQEHDASHADLRDALTVLTPDQLASAFEMMAEHMHGAGGPGGHGGPGMHGGEMHGHGGEGMRHPGEGGPPPAGHPQS